MYDPKSSKLKIGQDNITPFGLDIHNPVFVISGLTIFLFVVCALIFHSQAAEFFGWLLPAITRTFDWFFLTAGNLFVVFALLLVFLPIGRVRLGGPDAVPDFSYPGWFAMLFAAGMGIGLMYFGVSEPLSHYVAAIDGPVIENGVRTDSVPLGGAAGDVGEARDLAMAATIYHWGLHPWSIYAVVALALAFFAYNHGLPLTLRSAFYPILGDRVRGWWGHVIDVLAVFATLFGLATSLGLGATQALAGFNLLYGWGTGPAASVVLISVITSFAIISVVRGLDGGIKVLSGVNMVLALLLLLAILLVGPTGEILTTAVSGGAAYLAQIHPAGDAVRPRGHRLLPGLDRILLGLVGVVVAVRRHVHRPGLARPDGARVRRLRDPDPHSAVHPMDGRRSAARPSHRRSPTPVRRWRAPLRRSCCSRWSSSSR